MRARSQLEESGIQPDPIWEPRKDLPYLLAIVLLSVPLFYKLILHPGSVLIGPDLVWYHSFIKAYIAKSYREFGELPLWNHLVFAGTPLVGNIQANMFYPLQLLFMVFPTDYVFGPVVVLHVVAAGLGMYYFCRAIRLGRFGCLVAALVYMLNAKVAASIAGGHVNVIIMVAWTPLCMMLAEIAVHRRSWRWTIGTGLALGIAFLGSHPQFFYYASLMLSTYVLFRAIVLYGWQPRVLFAGVGRIAAMYGICVAVAAVQFLPTCELTLLHGQRIFHIDTKFALMCSLGWGGLADLFNPMRRFWPHPSQGSSFVWELAGYVSVTAMLLTIVSGAFKREKVFWFFLGWIVLSMALALGEATPAFAFFFRAVPGFRLFRNPNRMLYLYTFAMAVLAGYGASRIDAGVLHAVGRRTAKICVAFLAVAVLAGILLSRGWLFSGFWALAVVIGLLSTVGVVRGNALRALVIALIALDLWVSGIPRVRVDSPESYYAPSSCIEFLARERGQCRVAAELTDYPGSFLNLVSPLPQYRACRAGIEIIQGYDPIYLESLHEFLRLPCRHKVLDLLNVKYYVVPKPLREADGYRLVRQFPVEEKSYDFLLSPWIPPRPSFVYENLDLLPRAFLMDRSQRIESIKDVCEIDIHRVVGVEEDSKLETGDDDTGTATVTRYSPNKIEVLVEAKRTAVLVLSEVWYPGWYAYDGEKKLRIMRVYSVLRGVNVTPGQHRITFVYRPLSYRIGRDITALSLFTLAAFFAVGKARTVGARRKADGEEGP